jgi:transglutaminase-like putative cysteine protease
MNRYRLMHITEFQYDGPVSESYNEVRLRPMQDEMQTCLSFRIATTPISQPSAHLDFFGNWVHQFNVLPEHRMLRIETESVVLVQAPAPPDGLGIALTEFDEHRDEIADDFYDLINPTEYTPHVPELTPLVAAAEAESDGTVSGFLATASHQVHTRFRYEKGATQVKSTVVDALTAGAGVCQDFAHLLIAIARQRGIPARYVSGYLVPRRTAEPGASVEEVIGGQASHAWAEAYVSQMGWIALDPTLDKPVGIQHIRVAYGRDYGDVAPVRGVYKGHAGQRLSVDVRVRPALDDEGCEHLQETAAGPPPELEDLEPPQQQQQQQQQQQ